MNSHNPQVPILAIVPQGEWDSLVCGKLQPTMPGYPTSFMAFAGVVFRCVRLNWHSPLPGITPALVTDTSLRHSTKWACGIVARVKSIVQCRTIGIFQQETRSIRTGPMVIDCIGTQVRGVLR